MFEAFARSVPVAFAKSTDENDNQSDGERKLSLSTFLVYQYIIYTYTPKLNKDMLINEEIGKLYKQFFVQYTMNEKVKW